MKTIPCAIDPCRKTQYRALRRRFLAYVNCELRKTSARIGVLRGTIAYYINRSATTTCRAKWARDLMTLRTTFAVLHWLRDNPDGAYVTVSADDATRIAYSPTTKAGRVHKYDHARRRVTTLGRYLRPHFPALAESTLDEVVKLITAHMTVWTAELVCGNDITAVYEGERPSGYGRDDGHKTGSCMSHENAEYTAIYAAHPNQVVCLTMINGTQYLRRLVWFCRGSDDNADYIAMDRTYVAGGVDLSLATKIGDTWCAKHFADRINRGAKLVAFEDWPMVYVDLEWYADKPMPYLDSMRKGSLQSRCGNRLHLRLSNYRQGSECHTLEDTDGTNPWGEPSYECCGCDYASNDEDDFTIIGDNRYCESCIDNFSHCECCEEYVPSGDCRLAYRAVRGRHHEHDVCGSCRRNYYIRCQYSGEYWHDDDISQVIVDADGTTQNWGAQAVEDNAMPMLDADGNETDDLISIEEHERRQAVLREPLIITGEVSTAASVFAQQSLSVLLATLLP